MIKYIYNQMFLFTSMWDFTWRVSDCEELVYYCLRFLRTTDKKEKANNN